MMIFTILFVDAVLLFVLAVPTTGLSPMQARQPDASQASLLYKIPVGFPSGFV